MKANIVTGWREFQTFVDHSSLKVIGVFVLDVCARKSCYPLT
jgi:hypothetical protein